MRITCPSCQAVYDVPDRLLSPGRTVRCTTCAHAWEPLAQPIAATAAELEVMAEPTPAPAVLHADAEPPAATRPLVVTAPLRSVDPAPESRAPDPTAPPSAPELVVPPRTPAALDELEGGGGAWIGWLATLAVLVVLAWAAYTWRTEVMQAWPPSQRAYAALGLGPATSATPAPAHAVPTSPAPPSAPPQPANPQSSPPAGKSGAPAQPQ